MDKPGPSSGSAARPFTRRVALRWLAAAPAAAAIGVASASQDEGSAAAEAGGPPKPSPYAKFIAKHEEGLTREERSRLRKQSPGLEGALKKLRDFDLPDDVEPAIYFRAIRSSGRRGR